MKWTGVCEKAMCETAQAQAAPPELAFAWSNKPSSALGTWPFGIAGARLRILIRHIMLP